MTATTTPTRSPAHPPHAPSPGSGRPPAAPPAPPERAEADAFNASVAALTLLTVVAALGMGRLFADGTFMFPVFSAAVVTHLAAWWARRVGLGLGAAALVSSGALALVVAWAVLPHTTAYGIPWLGTWDVVSEEISRSWREFSRVVAPAPTTKGFVIAAVFGVGVTAFLADWAAYRVRATLEPLLPPFTLFLFASALGAPRHRAVATAFFVGAALLFLVVHQAALRSETTAWFASRSRGGLGALVQGAAAIGLAAVVAAVFLGPRLPGADAKALVSWRKTGDGDRSSRITTSPLVDIKGRLVNQTDREAFNVQSTGRAYWQMTTLDTFNGHIWSSNTTYQSVKQSLPGGINDEVKTDRMLQQFRIIALDAIWLPAAYRPTRIDGIKDVSYNADLGSLITKDNTANGLTYTVESEVPSYTPDQLRTANSSSPGRRYRELPSMPGDVVRLARDVTNPHPTAYDKARALQDFFRANFTYDLKVQAGHSDRALSRFLFVTKRGYCEQFAGAFAAMARSIGLHSRVAVGFTAGELQDDGRFHVRGLNAHAWPEVWLGQFGWVAFEPTPGRGNPQAVNHTGVPEMQDGPGQGGAPVSSTTTPPTVAPTPPPGGATSTTAFRDVVDTGGEFDLDEDKGLHPVLKLLIALAVGALLWAATVPLLLHRRRVRRRAAAATPVDRVLVAWAEAGEALARAGTPRRQSETVREYARRGPVVARLGPDAVEAMRVLADQTSVASYSAGTLPPETVARAVAAASSVEAAVERSAGWRTRLGWRLDPRPLLAERTRVITGKTGSPRARPA